MKLVKKEIDFYEVEVRFLVRKGAHRADSAKDLKECVSGGIGHNDMDGIEAEDIDVSVKE